ncbi:MAG TPA: alpha/beta hydrolase fold domain-containing protein [Asticcacaulis sp.]|nr:alpha/beta hydrolase fold domain-containing protein [Asticcacaulis sp.]
MQTQSLTTFLLRTALTLPAPVLRLLSGGAVVYEQGRTLDPEFQFLWRTGLSDRNGRPRLGVAGRPLDEARADWREMAARFATATGARVQVDAIGHAGVSGLLIRPLHIDDDMPLMVFFHQGGGVLGGPELSRAFGGLFAFTAHCPVFLPHYRLAPDHRFPAALEDARRIADWAQTNAFTLGAPSGRVALGGALTGAGLAARLCLDLKRDLKPQPAGQLLLTPLLDLGDPGLRDADKGLWPLNGADLNEIIANYAGGGHNLSDPRLSPGREKLLGGQPASLIVSAGFDPTAAQAESYARRLRGAGCETVYRRYDSLPLGFDLLCGLAGSARAATLDIAGLWRGLMRLPRSA